MKPFVPGYIPSPPDERDYPLAKAMTYRTMPIINRLVWVPQPVNQGEFGCCVAAALSGILEAIENKQRGVGIPTSVRYIYGNRAETDSQGEGMIPREALQMVSRFGSPRRELLPGVSNFPDAKAAVTPALDGEGLPFRIKGYVRLTSMQDISDYLALFGIPVLFCVPVTESFMRTGPDGAIPPPSGMLLGGHAMRCIGILQGKFVLQNSWGTGWGQSGIGYLNPDDDFTIEAWGTIPESSDSLINRPQVVMLTVGSTTMMVDVQKVILDSPPIIVNQRTMVPLRAISEALKGKVEYYGQADGRHIILLKWGGEQDDIPSQVN